MARLHLGDEHSNLIILGGSDSVNGPGAFGPMMRISTPPGPEQAVVIKSEQHGRLLGMNLSELQLDLCRKAAHSPVRARSEFSSL